jgi:serine/threonine-protein kinase
MDTQDESLRADFSGLLHLQDALNDLDLIAHCLRDQPRENRPRDGTSLADESREDVKPLDLMEVLAELFDNRGRTGLEPGITQLLTELVGSSRAIEPGRRGSSVPAVDNDRFQVLRPHAEGGLGTVSVALDRELKREVALKQIHARQADDPTRRDRFLVEAEITGGLEHPGIVPVYSLGHSSDGRPFYAMRLIRGETLADAIERFHATEGSSDPGAWGLELHRLLRRFIDVCNAIEYAHGRGILHRDLKPSNVMLGKHGETLVVDWGLAKPIGSTEPDERGEEGPLLVTSTPEGATLPGSAIGTPSFMSPEQAGGGRGSIGPTSDVYSLGATLYCLLTGETPFGSKDRPRILADVLEGRFRRPRQVNPRIARALEAVCLKAMALEPGDRHRSCRELADDVERWMADEPTSAYREPLNVRLRRWTRRKRSAVAAFVAAFLVGMAGLGVVLATQARANLELRQTNEIVNRINRRLEGSNARERARFELALEAIRMFHNGVSDDLVLREAEFAGLRSRLLRDAIGFYRKLEHDLESHSDRASREARARVYSQVASLEATLGSRREILAAYRKALDLRRELARETPDDPTARSEVASALISLGIMARDLEGPARGLVPLEEARSMLEPLTLRFPADLNFRDLLAQSHKEIGKSLALAGKRTEALAACDRSIAIQRRLADEDTGATHRKDALASVLHQKGVLQIYLNQYSAALETLQETRRLLDLLIEAEPANLRFKYELSNVLKDLGDLWKPRNRKVALSLHRKALATRESLSAALPGSVGYRLAIAYSLLAVGRIEALEGRKDDASKSFRRAIALQGNQPSSPIGLYNLAFTRLCLADCLEDSERECEASLAAGDFRRAIEAGYSNRSAIISLIQNQRSTRGNEDLVMLAADLQFPEIPFEQPAAADQAPR